ncbi:redox-sensitive bicupin YhaK (pirin superfamily) [Flavobacterium arsenatis]|uniref:Redox-sensitive bicupin YhaK (Pirin superfamily) n=1 Tax=Flavobacterium arsenatis TaxID=1484332 RepID=A0ABU1TQ46_9FLAO|nr:pirin family protein [Flavobacterium arsenatis]MDR6968110.1 redox-sensitive bicupin YhaK (pirin superfamily) [Flavobacterium arsenatis]
MKKKISFSTKGQRADIGDLTIYRLLANRYADAVGPFVFLDHIIPKVHSSAINSGTGGHPHRGIATLSYIIEGEDEHFDSAGNYAKVHSGGIQWMKAGNGIIHDETLNIDSKTGSNRTHAFQFWINLPAKNKAEKPAYLAVQSDDVPQKSLPDNSGWIKVIAGSYQDLKSIIPNYSEQFLYHIHLKKGKRFAISVDEKIEVAAFLPTKSTLLNDSEFQAGDFIEFDRNEGDIVIENKFYETTDIILFGGEPYTETIVAEGPFVMNSHSEIADAYRDFYAGKYGTINNQSRKV